MSYPCRASDCNVSPALCFCGSMSCFGSVSVCNVASSLRFCGVLILFPATNEIGWRTVETCISIMGLSLIRMVRSVDNKTDERNKKN
jgi:hypothetical protein